MNKFKLPDTLVIACCILLLAIILTWIIPSGEFTREVVDGRSVVVPGTFQTVEPSPQSILSFFIAPYKGFEKAVEVIAFIFFIGGAFGMINATGAIDAGLLKLVDFTLSNPLYKWFVIPLLIAAFAFAGGSFGLSEEVLVFVLITKRMGLKPRPFRTAFPDSVYKPLKFLWALRQPMRQNNWETKEQVFRMA